MSSMVEAPARRRLADMTPGELRQWLVERRKLFADHKRFIRRYVRRRAERGGKPTYTDRQYLKFQFLADDLLELLDSVIANIDQYEGEQRSIQELEAELEHLREAERRRLADIEIHTRQAEAHHLADAARHGEVAASIRLDQNQQSRS